MYSRYKDECFFCDSYKNKIGTFFENRSYYSRFDRYPLTPGHCEIIPKHHVVSIFELSATEFFDLHGALLHTRKFVESTNLESMYEEFSKDLKDVDVNSKWYDELSKNIPDGINRFYSKRMLSHVGIGKIPDAYTLGINDGEAAGRTIDHLHIHLIPRYIGDVKDPTAGIRNMFPEFGNYKNIKILGNIEEFLSNY